MKSMKRMSNEERFQALKKVVGEEPFGISAYGLLHKIASIWGLDDINSGIYLRKLSARINYYTRKLIKVGYPISERRIKCCSWSTKETWHPIFLYRGK